MSLNSAPVNSFAINEAAAAIIGVGEGQFITFEQITARIGSGEFITFEQEIQLKLSSTIAEQFIGVGQSVIAIHTGTAAPIEARVVNAAALTFQERNEWDVTIVIGGQQLSTDVITGQIEVNRTENDAALASFTVLGSIGMQDMDQYSGKEVTIDVHMSNGTHRLFTGVVDIPDVDMLEEKITFRCTDRRTELLNEQLANVVGEIGLWSEHIFQKPQDVAEEVRQRLETTPYAVDFDAHGNYTVTPWLPKSTPDYTLQDDDVYYDRPVVEFASRGRITNQVNINFQYRYERLYHHTRQWRWVSPISNDFCLFLQDGYSLTQRSMVLSAIDAVGWPVTSAGITWDEIHPSGSYRCGDRHVLWSTAQIRGENVPVLDENGQQVNDANGNPLTETRITGGTDYSNIFCEGAQWKGTQRWAQNITETYTFTVDAPQSQNQYGVIDEDLNYGMQAEYDISEWENYSSFRNDYNAQTSVGTQENYYINQDANREGMRTAVDVALNIAKTRILGSHRDTRVTVRSFLFPEADLKHTLLIDTVPLEAKGKVFNIRHVLDVTTGEAESITTIALFRATGSETDDPFTIPEPPEDTITLPTGNITLGNHFGQDPTTPQAAMWNGMIGNRWITSSNNTFKTQFLEQFIVDAPSIPDGFRNNKELEATAEYDISIPNDTLVITFDGKP